MCNVIQLDEHRKKKGKITYEDTNEGYVGFVIEDKELEKLLKEINEVSSLPF